MNSYIIVMKDDEHIPEHQVRYLEESKAFNSSPSLCEAIKEYKEYVDHIEPIITDSEDKTEIRELFTECALSAEFYNRFPDRLMGIVFIEGNVSLKTHIRKY